MTRQSTTASCLKAFLLTIFAVSLSGCSNWLDGFETVVDAGAFHEATLQAMTNLNVDRAAPVMLRIYKEERTMEIWKQDRTGNYVLLKAYPICNYSGTLGPKIREGDRQAPEGFYEITPEQMNPLSHEYLSFNIGFPNAFDRALGRTGSFIMVHGGCRSIGCYAMTDVQMEEIYSLLAEAFRGGQDKVQLQALPFRMTQDNLALHANRPEAPFWSMLKEGSDAFAKLGNPPIVAVCNQRYVFNPAPADQDLDPTSTCPPGTSSTPLTVSSRLSETLSPVRPTEKSFVRQKVQFLRKRFVARFELKTPVIMREEVARPHSSAKVVAFHNVKGHKGSERHARSTGRA